MVAASRARLITVGSWPMYGSWANQERTPTLHHSLPMETFIMARTTIGSNCEPACRESSSRAATGLMGFL